MAGIITAQGRCLQEKSHCPRHSLPPARPKAKDFVAFLFPHLLIYLLKVFDVLPELGEVFFVPCTCQMVEVMIASGVFLFLNTKFFSDYLMVTAPMASSFFKSQYIFS
jgi:hypothetical protein